MRATIGRLLLGNGSVYMPQIIRDDRRRRFQWSPPQRLYNGMFQRNGVVGRSWESSVHFSELSRIGSSSGDGSRRWLRINGRKGIGRCQEDFIRDLNWQWDCYKSVARIRLMKTENWQWDCYKSVARIRLVKTENPSACVTVNWKVCRSAIAL
jgi:hypothetical protein